LWHVFGEILNPLPVKFNNFPWTSPDALFAVCATLIDDRDFGFEKFDGILGTDSDATTAKIALAGNNMDHQGSGSFSFIHSINLRISKPASSKRCEALCRQAI
jgi:hypothetical protein